MAQALTATARLDDWTGEDVTLAQVERELARLRGASSDGGAANLRTSVLTHVAWVPEPWLERALEVMAGLEERYPSRTLVLVPEPDAPESRLDAEVSLRCFPLGGEGRNVCAEVILLRLRGTVAQAPASVVLPLVISDLPVFCRWRGEPGWGSPELEGMLDVVDRLVVDSREWDDLPGAYARLAEAFGRTAISDIAWARSLEWRAALARLWPEIGSVERLHVRGPRADALLLAGWLRDRLEREIALDHEDAEWIDRVEVDGDGVAPPRGGRATPSDLLSDELDRFGRDPVYERAALAAAS